MGCSSDKYRDTLSVKSMEKVINFLSNNYKVVGLGATILNGYSYVPCTCGLTIYTPVPELDGMSCIFRRMIYLEGYNTEIGYEESNISSPERNICDYLMYPEKLGAGSYLLDAMEGYEEEFGNFDKVYEMMEKFNIPREKLDEWMDSMWVGD